MRNRDQWLRQPALHAAKTLSADPAYEVGLAAHLAETLGAAGLLDLYGRFVMGAGGFDAMMRRAIWRALARAFGNAVTVEPGALFRHLERIEIGNGVLVGAQSIIQGRFDGACWIGDRVWIGPQAHLDARDLVIEAGAGIGVGARIMGVEHSGEPAEIGIIESDQLVGPVRIGAGALISTGAMIMPGVTIGAGAWIGAGSVVLTDIPERAVAVGAPAKVIRIRSGGEET